MKYITNEKSTITISEETKDELKVLGIKGEDYETIIKNTINFTKKFSNETQFHLWFVDNYQLFGFDQIKENNLKGGFPDFIMLKDGREVRVELETLSANFIYHKHDPDQVDLVICLIKNRELPVETIEITPFEYPTKTSITITEKTKERMKNIGKMGDTFEEVLEKLLVHYKTCNGVKK